jgi:amyloid beta precursor protein binding protein 1
MVKEPGFFARFSTVIVATGYSAKMLLPLAAELQRLHVPLLVARTYGMIGYLRLAIDEHTVVEVHPDDSSADLRLCAPWPALAAFLDSFDLAALENPEFVHVPAVVFIHQMLVKVRGLLEGGGVWFSLFSSHFFFFIS